MDKSVSFSPPTQAAQVPIMNKIHDVVVHHNNGSQHPPEIYCFLAHAGADRHDHYHNIDHTANREKNLHFDGADKIFVVLCAGITQNLLHFAGMAVVGAFQLALLTHLTAFLFQEQDEEGLDQSDAEHGDGHYLCNGVVIVHLIDTGGGIFCVGKGVAEGVADHGDGLDEGDELFGEPDGAEGDLPPRGEHIPKNAQEDTEGFFDEVEEGEGEDHDHAEGEGEIDILLS